ncbi:hypothetical protein Tco_1216040 [Tanacetum coccineum]
MDHNSRKLTHVKLHIDKSIPQNDKGLGSSTLPFYINNVCFDNALADLEASVSVMPLSAYPNLGLGELAHTKLTAELAYRTIKYPKRIAKNVLVGIGKFVFPVNFIILDMPEDVKVSLILERPFLSTAHAKINVFKRKITLRVGDEKIIFKSVKPTSSLIKRVYMLSLRERMELDLESRLMGETLVLNRSLDPLYGDYIELNDLNVPLELKRDQVDDLMPTIKEGEWWKIWIATEIKTWEILFLENRSAKLHVWKQKVQQDQAVTKASIIEVINHESSVTPLPSSKKKGKKKYQTANIKPPKEKVPMEDSDKTQSVSSGQNTHPQDTERTTQPAVKGFHSLLDEGTRKSNPLPEGKPTDPQDIERNKQPAVKGLFATHPDDGAGTKYQDELKDDSDEEMRETREELDEEFLQSENEETQHAHSNKTPTKDPISTEQQSPLPNKDHPESAKDKKTDASDSESSSFQNDVKEDPALNKKVLEASVGPRMTRIENTQANIQYNLASLKTDTSEIKAMMTEIFCTFKGQSFSTSSSSVSKTTLVITEGDKDNMITEEHVSKTADAEKEPEQEPQDTEPIPITIVMPIVTSTKTKIIGYSSRPQLTDHILEVQVLQPENPSHTTPKLDRGKGIARDTHESTIKHVPKSKEVCQDPDAHFLIPFEIRQEFKPEKITNIHIHLNTKLVAITVYKDNDRSNFDVHKPFRFGDFGVTEWDELGAIIPKKKIKVVEDLMTSFQKKYERLRSLPKGVSFINNLVIEQPKNGLFFIDVFGDEASQRMSDIHKGHEASEALPQKKRKSKTQITSLVKANIKPPKEKVPMEDSDKTQSVSSGQNTHPQDTKRTTQPAVKGFHSPLDKGTHKSNLGLRDELKDDSDEEMRVTGEELDEEFLQSKNEETQHAHSNKTPTEDPISTEHQSPLPNKDHPEILQRQDN